MKPRTFLLGAVVLASALGLSAAAGAGASGAPAPTNGTVHVWAVPGRGAVDQILLTGVIADHGTATTIDKDGKVDPNGHYVMVKLQAGGFEVNASEFDEVFEKLQPTVNAATCSAWATGTGPVSLFNGTGSYTGITGTIRITSSYAIIFPRYATGAKKGQCNERQNAQPVAQFEGDITGSGAVGF